MLKERREITIMKLTLVEIAMPSCSVNAFKIIHEFIDHMYTIICT